ncbi:MAG: ACT domain-containing protein [Gemmatimonadetes bacterium]|nr:ACT domain-containing protein [Gemmatimonadota bacterium]
MPQTLLIEPGDYAVCQLSPDDALPAWLPKGPFWTVTRAGDELSIICPADVVPEDCSHEGGWRLLRMVGPFPFTLTGILESVLTPLAAADVGILAISTFNTDYVLVKHTRLAVATDALRAAGHVVRDA